MYTLQAYIARVSICLLLLALLSSGLGYLQAAEELQLEFQSYTLNDRSDSTD